MEEAPIVTQSENPVAAGLRRLLVALLILFMAGTAADLLLLEHYDGSWQLVPLGLLAAGIVAAAVLLRGGAGAVLGMRVLMAIFIAAGLIGLGLHFGGNSEFQRELDPALQGWPLFVKVMTAKAPPALAPASMIHMGLLGLLCTYRHPALRLHAPASTASGESV